MAAILGISAFFHDSAAALVVDGRIVAAAQEERFSRRRHDSGFPTHAVRFCLDYAGLDAASLDHVAFYEKPLRKFDRLLETYLAYAPRGYANFRQMIPAWLRQKLFVPTAIREALMTGAGESSRGGVQEAGGPEYRGRIAFLAHHQSHAASAFFPSPFEQATIVTIDGVGEWATTTIGRGVGNQIDLLDEIRFPNSLGLLYSAFTYHAGFRVDSGEYKLMGLAPYGTPRYAALIREKLLDLKSDGSFRLDQRYFNYCQGLTMTNRAFARLFDGPPRRPEGPLTQRELDLAASVQAVTEEAVLRIAQRAYARTGIDQLCLAGGVALNCVANGRLLREGPFQQIWVQPAAGDAGGALGAALLVAHQLLGEPRPALTVAGGDGQAGSLLGPAYGDAAIQADLQAAGTVFTALSDLPALAPRVASLLAAGQVVGWFQGRMEFGPRALGNRSILADPRRPEMQSLLNRKIKFRESFRPFAPSILREHASKYFEISADQESPYMLFCAPVHPDQRIPVTAADAQRQGLDQQHVLRSTLPAVTHVDGSARLQTVDRGRFPEFHTLLESFYHLTGCPALVNTSFNVRGEPIVATPADAIRCFLATDMDALAVGRFLLLKENQPADRVAAARATHLARYGAD